jgi:predicted dienelactone hydrolase
MLKKLSIIIFLASPLFACAQQQAIGERTFRYKDTLRNRPVTTEVWYPTDEDNSKASTPAQYPFIHIPTIRGAKVQAKKHPLVMISHGTGGGRMTLEWLADILVQHGFIVAAVDHYGNTYDNKIAIDFVTPWQRPQDISFALTQLLKDKDFGQAIDANRVGAAGFSIGGYTVIALAGAKLNLEALTEYSNTPGGVKEMTLPEFPNLAAAINEDEIRASFAKSPDLKDRRIKAVFAICPAIGQGFTVKSQFKLVDIPVYIVGAASDSIAPVKTNAMHYHQLIKGSKLLIIPGKAGHYVFLNEATEQAKRGAEFLFSDDAF